VDVERTIQFILKSQANAEIRMDKAERERKRAEARAKARVDAMEVRLDKRTGAITKLLQHGMRMLVKTDTKLAELAESQKELAETQKELAEAQKATDRALKAFINSLRNGRNGR